MTNIKNPFGLVLKALNAWPIFLLKMILVLCFFDLANEVDWNIDLFQVFVIGQVVSNPFVYTIIVRFVVFTPSMYRCACVVCITWFHLLDNLSKVAIHFGTHAHPMVENKCIEFIDEMIVRRKTCIFYWFL
jgi:hypothetical protein